MKRILVGTLMLLGAALPARPAAITGLELGYLSDWKEAYYAGRLGYEVKAAGTVSHQLEAEIGYTKKTESVGVTGGVVKVTGKITPLMANYRAVFAGPNKVGGYVGAGLGTARVSASGSGFGVSVSDGDNAMAYQAFGGITYQASEATSLLLGVKYISIGDVEIMGVDAEIGEDFGISAGISFKF